MNFSDTSFEVEFTDECIKEMDEIYQYINDNLKAGSAAKKLMSEVANRILNLSELPELYMKIGKTDKLKRDYHRIVVKNYIILYSIDFQERKVFISHMIYGRKNYLS